MIYSNNRMIVLDDLIIYCGINYEKVFKKIYIINKQINTQQHLIFILISHLIPRYKLHIFLFLHYGSAICYAFAPLIIWPLHFYYYYYYYYYIMGRPYVPHSLHLLYGLFIFIIIFKLWGGIVTH